MDVHTTRAQHKMPNMLEHPQHGVRLCLHFVVYVVYTDGISLCVNLIIKKPRCRKSDFPSSVRAQGLLPINTLILSFFFLFCAPTHTLNLPFRFAAVRDYRRKDDLLCYAMYGLEAKS